MKKLSWEKWSALLGGVALISGITACVLKLYDGPPILIDILFFAWMTIMVGLTLSFCRVIWKMA